MEACLTRCALWVLPLLLVFSLAARGAESCGSSGIAVQVLGSGGPEMQDKRASSSYLVWRDGKARVLVDVGGGSALRFGQSGAMFPDLDVVLFTHFHADHSADFPALIKSAWFEDRERDLPVFGPTGNSIMPSAAEFVDALFNSEHGAFRYLSEFITPDETSTYKLQTQNVDTKTNKPHTIYAEGGINIVAAPVEHGPIPAIAYRVEVAGKVIAFSGDTNGDNRNLIDIARNADIFVAHNAVPEGTTGVARQLHMPPSVIGRIAATAHVKKVVLSHRMLRTLGVEKDTLAYITKTYHGKTVFADDLDCYRIK
jgi:ribonuclease BN (tRNA processing enzyme)